MNSAYIQRASQASANQTDVKFTNLSNQQMYPGDLFKFYGEQAAALQPMPFTNDDIQVPAQQSFAFAMTEEVNNVSQMPRNDRIDMFYRSNVESKHVQFRTPSQRVWNVPFDQTELRATDFW